MTEVGTGAKLRFWPKGHEDFHSETESYLLKFARGGQLFFMLF